MILQDTVKDYEQDLGRSYFEKLYIKNILVRSSSKKVKIILQDLIKDHLQDLRISYFETLCSRYVSSCIISFKILVSYSRYSLLVVMLFNGYCLLIDDVTLNY